jgi:hypothetical protein
MGTTINSAYNMNILSISSLSGFIQILILIVMILFVIISFLVTRQVHILNKTLSTPLNIFFSQAAFIQLIISGVVVFLAFISV